MNSHELIFNAVWKELQRAERLYPNYNSAHEAYAVIQEEVDEFWELVKNRNHDHQGMTEELIQVAAVAIRAVLAINKNLTVEEIRLLLPTVLRPDSGLPL